MLIVTVQQFDVFLTTGSRFSLNKKNLNKHLINETVCLFSVSPANVLLNMLANSFDVSWTCRMYASVVQLPVNPLLQKIHWQQSMFLRPVNSCYLRWMG